MTLRHRSLPGVAMLAATAIAWGGMFPVLKPLLSILDPITLTLIRFGLATPILVALLLVIEGRSALAFNGRALRLWWLGTLGFAGFGLLLVIGLRMTQPQHAAVMPALMPLITVIITAIRSRSLPTGRGLFAVLVGLAGVVLVVTAGHPAVLLQGSVGGGEALVLAGATCWVLYTLGAAGFPGWSGLRYTTLTLILGTMTIVGVEMVALATGHAAIPDRAAFGRAASGMAYMVLAASVMGFLFWNAGMRALGPRMGVLFINLVPVTAFTIALIGGQIPSPWEVAGVALVIAALLLNSLGVAARFLPRRGVPPAEARVRARERIVSPTGIRPAGETGLQGDDFPIARRQQLLQEAVLLRKGAQIGAADGAVVHRLHMAGNQKGFGSGLMDGEHILRSHDDAAVDAGDHGIAGVQDRHVRPVGVQGDRNIVLPDRVAGEVDGLLAILPEHDAAGLAEKIADYRIMRLGSVPKEEIRRSPSIS